MNTLSRKSWCETTPKKLLVAVAEGDPVVVNTGKSFSTFIDFSDDKENNDDDEVYLSDVIELMPFSRKHCIDFGDTCKTGSIYSKKLTLVNKSEDDFTVS